MDSMQFKQQTFFTAGGVQRWVPVAILVAVVVAGILSCVVITVTFTGDASIDEKLHDLKEAIKNLKLQSSHGGIITDEINATAANPERIIRIIRPVNVFQINTRGNGLATKAIDGNPNADYTKGSCTHTESVVNPWWCANLGSIYHVSRVVAVNRNDGGVETRALNLRVGFTNIMPVVGQPLALDAYTLCAEKPGLMGEVGVVNCPYTFSGRYLVVQFRTTNYMHVCEIEIYGYRK